MRFLIICFLLFLSYFPAKCQDTIYSYPYPNGIITKSLIDKIGYRFTPVENPNLLIVVSKSETIKIRYHTKEKFTNANYKPTNAIVLSTEAYTGKIHYEGIMEFKNTTSKNLYNSFKGLSQGTTKYVLVASDEAEKSQQKYVGSFMTKFQGDPYSVNFNIILKFKEGKIYYEYSDFVAVFSKNITKGGSSEIMPGILSNNTTTIEKSNIKTLDQLYARGARNDDKQKFWSVIKNNIDDSILLLQKLGNDAIAIDKW